MSITKFLNTSINIGHFPTKWKLGWVTPIHKVGNKSECNNFRHITILCTLNKHLGWHVHHSYYKLLQNNGLLYIIQSGFHTLHSCETALTNGPAIWKREFWIGQYYLIWERHLTLLTLMYCCTNCHCTSVMT